RAAAILACTCFIGCGEAPDDVKLTAFPATYTMGLPPNGPQQCPGEDAAFYMDDEDGGNNNTFMFRNHRDPWRVHETHRDVCIAGVCRLNCKNGSCTEGPRN